MSWDRFSPDRAKASWPNGVEDDERRDVLFGTQIAAIVLNRFNLCKPDSPSTVFVDPATLGPLNQATGLIAQPNNGELISAVWNYFPSARGDSLWCKFASPYVLGLDPLQSLNNYYSGQQLVFKIKSPWVTRIGPAPGQVNFTDLMYLTVSAVLDNYDPTTLTYLTMPVLQEYRHTVQNDGVTPDPYQGPSASSTEQIFQELALFNNQSGMNASNDTTGNTQTDSYGEVDNTSLATFTGAQPSSNSTFTITFAAGIPNHATQISRMIGQTFEILSPVYPTSAASTKYTIVSVHDNGDGTGLVTFSGASFNPCVDPVSGNPTTCSCVRTVSIYGIAITLVSQSNQGEGPALTLPYYSIASMDAIVANGISVFPVGFQ